MADKAEQELHDLADRITDLLGADLLGLYVHGSWTGGDFVPQRSDLDLLAVLRSDPEPSLLTQLGKLHASVATDHPAWADRVEVEYLSLDGLARSRSDPRPMVRISPGEPIHLVPATSHYVLNWHAARTGGVALFGPEPRLLMPEIPEAEVRAVVLEHIRQWPGWVSETPGPGFQAYAVLTLCRAWSVVVDGVRRSKRQAADEVIRRLPEWAPLVTWARRWWYEGGSADEPDRLPSVRAFVVEVARQVDEL